MVDTVVVLMVITLKAKSARFGFVSLINPRACMVWSMADRMGCATPKSRMESFGSSPMEPMDGGRKYLSKLEKSAVESWLVTTKALYDNWSKSGRLRQEENAANARQAKKIFFILVL